MKESRQNIIFAVLFSLVIHIVLGATLFYNLSANLSFPKSFSKLNMVWVTLNAQNNTNVVVKDLRPLAPSRRSITPQGVITGETPEIGKVSREVTEASAPKVTGAVILGSYDKPVAKTVQEQISGAPGGVAGEAAGNPALVNAYPQYLENVPPVYPQIARIRGYEGVVLISTEILPGGNVGNLRIKKSSGYAILDRAALEAVKNWKFEPAKKMGKPYATWRDHLIKFFLNDDNSQS